jgi:cytoskeletal protein RodZ
MGLKRSEKMLVGLGMMAGGLALLIGVGLPQWDAYSATNTQIAALNDEIKLMDSQKTSLNAQIALLEKNTDIPPDIHIRTYTEQSKDEVIKAMLDQLVNMATDTGNKFISLSPDETAAPIVAPPPVADKAKDVKAQGNQAAQTASTPATGDAAAGQSADPNAPPEVPPPILSTFGYNLSIRGTYDSLQRFLRSLDSQKELMEVSAIQIENEAGADRAGGDSGAAKTSDPMHPLKLTASVRIVLQPE